MRIFLLVMLLISQTVFSNAQNTFSGLTELKVVEWNFQPLPTSRGGGNPFTTSFADAALARVSMRSDSDTSFSSGSFINDAPRWKYRVELSVKNTSNKTITAVEWQPPLVFGLKKEKTLNYSFKVKQKILPGETVTLSKVFSVSKRLRPDNAAQPEIKSVGYSDGSRWEKD